MSGLGLANQITLARAVATLVVWVLLVLGGAAPSTTLVIITFVVFTVAAATDFLDGMLARRTATVSVFGRIADPFADKVLITGTLITLLQYPVATKVLTTWFVVIVVAREFLVTAIRGFVESIGTPFPADRLGKYKMIAQCVTCGALLTMVAGTGSFYWFAVVGFWLSLVLTVVSGLNYVIKALAIVKAGAAA